MASFARNLLTELLTVLRADLGDYVLTTANNTPRVVVGNALDPACEPPYVWIAPPENIVDTYQDAALGEIGQAGRIPLLAFVPSDSLDESERILDALDMAEEVERAVLASHRNSTYTTIYGLLQLWFMVEDVGSGGGDMPVDHAWFTAAINYRRVTVSGGV